MNQLTSIFKLLSDETRLRIILLLFEEDLCVCELCGVLDLSQPKVSKTLAKLRDLDLVSVTRKEKFMFYSLKQENSILTETLKGILNHSAQHPQLLLDKERLSDKEVYLSNCCVPDSSVE